MSMNLITATSDSFAPFVKETFVFKTEVGDIELVLHNVKLYPDTHKRDAVVEIDGVEIPARQPFSLTWEGPREPVVPQGNYEVSHPVAGSITLMVKPFMQDARNTVYESIFG